MEFMRWAVSGILTMIILELMGVKMGSSKWLVIMLALWAILRLHSAYV